MYLKKFGIENFRIFQNPVEFEFKPITILIGQNNSGKSTVLKALNLLIENSKRAGKETNFPDLLYTNFHSIGIGSSKQLLSDSGGYDTLEFKFAFEGNKALEHSIFFDILNDYYLLLKYKIRSDSTEIIYLEELSIANSKSTLIAWKLTNKINKEENEDVFGFFDNDYIFYPDFAEKINSIINSLKGEFIEISNRLFRKDGKYISYKDMEDMIKSIENYEPNKNDLTELNGNKYDTIELSILLRWCYSLYRCLVNFYGLKNEPILDSMELFITDLKSNCKVEMIINPGFGLRRRFLGPKSGYSALLVGIMSELFSSIEKHFQNDYRSQDNQNTIPKRYFSPMDSDQISNMLFTKDINIDDANELISNILGVADEIKIENLEEGFLKKILIVKKDREYNLSDMGYGITRLIPFILNPDYSSPEYGHQPHIWLLSEPEANLHPSLQSKLANLFVHLMHNSGSRFIIETHSEYIIRKLQYLIRKTDSPLKPEDVVIYYFYHPDEIPPGESQIKTITIDAEGNLSENFPPGFYDESSRISLDLWNMNASQKN